VHNYALVIQTPTPGKADAAHKTKANLHHLQNPVYCLPREARSVGVNRQ